MNSLNRLEFTTVGDGPVVVYAHGTPTYSGEFQKVANQIGGSYKSILVDHLGFGSSSKPLEGDYSILAHQTRFRETLVSNGFKKVHLVVHDFGGAIALPLMTDPNFAVLSLTIINSWYWPLIETEPQMNSQKKLVDWGILPFFYKHLNLSPRVLLKMAWGSHSPLSKERHQHYISKFPTKEDREGLIGFLRLLFDFNNTAWKQMDKLAQISVPIQIIWGEADKLISIRNLERWISIFPTSKVVRLKNVGHFVADEAPELLSRELLDFFRAVNLK